MKKILSTVVIYSEQNTFVRQQKNIDTLSEEMTKDSS